MCGELHYGEVEGLVSVESGLVAEVLHVWWSIKQWFTQVSKPNTILTYRFA